MSTKVSRNRLNGAPSEMLLGELLRSAVLYEKATGKKLTILAQTVREGSITNELRLYPEQLTAVVSQKGTAPKTEVQEDFWSIR